MHWTLREQPKRCNMRTPAVELLAILAWLSPTLTFAQAPSPDPGAPGAGPIVAPAPPETPAVATDAWTDWWWIVVLVLLVLIGGWLYSRNRRS